MSDLRLEGYLSKFDLVISLLRTLDDGWQQDEGSVVIPLIDLKKALEEVKTEE